MNGSRQLFYINGLDLLGQEDERLLFDKLLGLRGCRRGVSLQVSAFCHPARDQLLIYYSRIVGEAFQVKHRRHGMCSMRCISPSQDQSRRQPHGQMPNSCTIPPNLHGLGAVV